MVNFIILINHIAPFSLSCVHRRNFSFLGNPHPAAPPPVVLSHQNNEPADNVPILFQQQQRKK